MEKDEKKIYGLIFLRWGNQLNQCFNLLKQAT